jgi:hypothetical protein
MDMGDQIYFFMNGLRSNTVRIQVSLRSPTSMNQIQQEDSEGEELRSCLALDQELENEDASKSKELSQILMRLFLPSVIACIWIPLIECSIFLLLGYSMQIKLAFTTFIGSAAD